MTPRDWTPITDDDHMPPTDIAGVARLLAYVLIALAGAAVLVIGLWVAA